MSPVLSLIRRLPMALAAVLLLAGFTLVGPMAGAAQAYPRYCSTTSPDRNTQITTCVQITKIYNRVFNVIYRDGVRNSRSGAASMTCSATTAKTFTWHVDTSVKAEAGLIFAHVSAEISGGISHSVTSTYGASVTKSVPAHTTMFCDRGVYTYSFKGQVVKTVCSNANCSNGTRNFSGVAPQRALWNVYYGH